MFIYSNHYLIVCKLTREDFKDYFTNELRRFDYTVIESTTVEPVDYHDYIDLAICEFESSNFVNVKPDTIFHIDDTNAFLGHNDEEIMVEEYESNQIISDIQYSMWSDPFFTIHWRRGGVRFFPNLRIWTKAEYDAYYADEVPYNLKSEEERKAIDKKDKEIELKHLMVARAEVLNVIDIEFKEEDLEKSRFFPKTENFVYFFNNESAEYINDCNENDSVESFQEDSHHIMNQDLCLDLDPIELEYWHEPLFAFGTIREMHFHRTEKDFFTDLYTSPISCEWFHIGEFDHSPERFA
jgi:hypothetical protein